MKIIEIGTGYTPIPAKIGAATEIVIENLIIGFNNSGIENEIIDITYTKQIKHTLYNNELNTFVHYLQLPYFLSKIADKGFIHFSRRILYSIKVGCYLRKYLKHETNILLHFHNQFNFFFVHIIAKNVIKTNKIKTIYTIHTPDWPNWDYIPKKMFLESFAIKKSDIVISLTNIIKNKVISLSKNIDKTKIIVIPNGVSIVTYRPLNYLKKSNSILNIGSICERKNQLDSIKVLKEFLIKNSFKFIFAGKIVDNLYFEKIKLYIIENKLEKYVEYVGEIKPGKELNILYNSSMFYFSNSRNEAFSLVILESMSAGLPVILSDSFNSFLDKSDKLRSVIKIISNDEVENTFTELFNNVGLFDNYRTAQIEFAKSNYDWGKIAISINKELNQKLFLN